MGKKNGMITTTTTTLRGVEFEVKYTLHPEEKEVRTYRNGDPGHPGYPEYAEIDCITHNGTDFSEFIQDEDRQKIEKLIIKQHEL